MSDKFDVSGRFFMSDKLGMSGRGDMSVRFGTSDGCDIEDGFAMGDRLTGMIHLPSIHSLDRNHNFDK